MYQIFMKKDSEMTKLLLLILWISIGFYTGINIQEPQIEYREVEGRMERACNRLSGNLQCIVGDREHFIILPE